MNSERVRGWAKALCFLVAVALGLYLALKMLPCPTLRRFMNRQNSTRFYDRNQILLYVLPLENGLRREYVPLKKIPRQLIEEFIAAEDRNFYRHCGIDIASVVRAAMQNRRAGRLVSGASTITMQLVRMLYPRKTRQVTVPLKMLEMLRALYLEIKLSKNQILELYLNSVPFGFQLEGLGSAARAFYGVNLFSLTEAQMQELARIPRRPAKYAPQKTYVYQKKCPHFVNYVVAQFAQQHKRIPDELCLSVDSVLVERTEKNIQKKLDEYHDARVHNGAALVMNNRTGQILVWVGNASFEDKEHSGEIDGVLVRNQPGSSMKPFLYALALERGFAPNSVLPDIQQDYGGSQVYVPLNFNNRYNGPVRFRVALASSLNIPAVYVLYQVGLDEYLATLASLHFDSLHGQRGTTGLSLALGSGEVTLYEMVRAFSVFVRDGTVFDSLVFTADSVGAGNKNIPNTHRVFEADTARILCSMLSDGGARELGFGHAAVFATPYPALFKTGTSNQFQNIIAMGSTSEYTAGVWMGNFEGETVIRQTGSSIPAAIVRDLLDILTEESGAQDFGQPEHFEKQTVCALSGMAITDACAAMAQEYVLKPGSYKSVGVQPLQSCTWHSKKNGAVRIHYPSEYQHWASTKNIAGDIAKTDSELSFVYPINHAVFVYDLSIPQQAQMLSVEVVGGSEQAATLFADGQRVGIARGRFVWQIPLTRGTHELTVQCGQEQKSIEYSVR